MTEEQAIAIADAFVREQLGSDPRLLGDRLSYSFLHARRGRNQEWRIVFQWTTPDNPSIIDGPAVVIVDPVTQKARFFNTG
jgi:hypothetical protein